MAMGWKFGIVMGGLALVALAAVMSGPAVADHVMTVLREVETNPPRAKTVIGAWWSICLIGLVGVFGIFYILVTARREN